VYSFHIAAVVSFVVTEH